MTQQGQDELDGILFGQAKTQETPDELINILGLDEPSGGPQGPGAPRGLSEFADRSEATLVRGAQHLLQAGVVDTLAGLKRHYRERVPDSMMLIPAKKATSPAGTEYTYEEAKWVESSGLRQEDAIAREKLWEESGGTRSIDGRKLKSEFHFKGTTEAERKEWAQQIRDLREAKYGEAMDKLLADPKHADTYQDDLVDLAREAGDKEMWEAGGDDEISQAEVKAAQVPSVEKAFDKAFGLKPGELEAEATSTTSGYIIDKVFTSAADVGGFIWGAPGKTIGIAGNVLGRALHLTTLKALPRLSGVGGKIGAFGLESYLRTGDGEMALEATKFAPIYLAAGKFGDRAVRGILGKLPEAMRNTQTGTRLATSLGRFMEGSAAFAIGPEVGKIAENAFADAVGEFGLQNWGLDNDTRQTLHSMGFRTYDLSTHAPLLYNSYKLLYELGPALRKAEARGDRDEVATLTSQIEEANGALGEAALHALGSGLAMGAPGAIRPSMIPEARRQAPHLFERSAKELVKAKVDNLYGREDAVQREVSWLEGLSKMTEALNGPDVAFALGKQLHRLGAVQDIDGNVSRPGQARAFTINKGGKFSITTPDGTVMKGKGAVSFVADYMARSTLANLKLRSMLKEEGFSESPFQSVIQHENGSFFTFNEKGELIMAKPVEFSSYDHKGKDIGKTTMTSKWEVVDYEAYRSIAKELAPEHGGTDRLTSAITDMLELRAARGMEQGPNTIEIWKQTAELLRPDGKNDQQWQESMFFAMDPAFSDWMWEAPEAALRSLIGLRSGELNADMARTQLAEALAEKRAWEAQGEGEAARPALESLKDMSPEQLRQLAEQEGVPRDKRASDEDVIMSIVGERLINEEHGRVMADKKPDVDPKEALESEFEMAVEGDTRTSRLSDKELEQEADKADTKRARRSASEQLKEAMDALKNQGKAHGQDWTPARQKEVREHAQKAADARETLKRKTNKSDEEVMDTLRQEQAKILSEGATPNSFRALGDAGRMVAGRSRPRIDAAPTSRGQSLARLKRKGKAAEPKEKLKGADALLEKMHKEGEAVIEGPREERMEMALDVAMRYLKGQGSVPTAGAIPSDTEGVEARIRPGAEFAPVIFFRATDGKTVVRADGREFTAESAEKALDKMSESGGIVRAKGGRATIKGESFDVHLARRDGQWRAWIRGHAKAEGITIDKAMDALQDVIGRENPVYREIGGSVEAIKKRPVVFITRNPETVKEKLEGAHVVSHSELAKLQETLGSKIKDAVIIVDQDAMTALATPEDAKAAEQMARSAHATLLASGADMAGNSFRRSPGVEKVSEGPSANVDQIQRSLEKATGVKLRAGRGRHKQLGAAAWFQAWSRAIRSERARDLIPMVHESGHALQQPMLDMAQPASAEPRKPAKKGGILQEYPWPEKVKEDLLKLGKDLYGETVPEKVLLTEGWAEYWARFMLQKWHGGENIEKTAPGLHDWVWSEILATKPELRDDILASKKLFDRYHEQGAIERVKAHITTEEAEHPSAKEFIERSMPGGVMTWLRRNLEDDLIDLFLAEKRFQKETGVKLKPTESGYTMMTYLRGRAPAVATHMLEVEAVDSYGRKVGPSLKTILEPIPNEKFGDFQAYVYALRHVTLNEGRTGAERFETGIRDVDAMKVFDAFKNEPGFHEAAMETHGFFDNVLKYARDNGHISHDGYEKIRIKHPFYVPLKRHFEEHELVQSGSAGGAGGAVGQATKGVKSLSEGGSKRRIRDLRANAKEIVNEMVAATHKSVALNALVNAYETHAGFGGVIQPIEWKKMKTSAKIKDLEKQLKEKLGVTLDELEALLAEHKGELGDLQAIDRDAYLDIWKPNFQENRNEPTVTVFRDGKLKAYEVVDPAAYRVLMNLDKPTLDGVAQTASWLGKGIRMGAVTASPAFALKNTIFRDPIMAAIASKQGGWTKVPVANMLLGAAEYLQRGKEGGNKASQYLGLGGSFSTLMSQMYTPSHTVALRRIKGISKAERLKNLMTLNPMQWFAEASVTVKEGVRKAQEVIGAGEMFPRILEFKAALKRGEELYGKGTMDATIFAALEAQDITANFARAGTAARALNPYLVFLTAGIAGVSKEVRTFAKGLETIGEKKSTTAAVSMALATITVPAIVEWFLGRDDERWRNRSKSLADSSFTFYHEDGSYWKFPKLYGPGYAFGTVVTNWLEERVQKGDTTALDEAWEITKRFLPIDSLPLPSGLRGLYEVSANWNMYRGRPIVSKWKEEAIMDKDLYHRWNTSAAKFLGKGMDVSPAKIDHLLNSLSGGAWSAVAGVTDMGSDRSKIPAVGALMGEARPFGSRDQDKAYRRREELRKKSGSAKLGTIKLEPGEAAELRRLNSWSKKMSALREKHRDGRITEEQAFERATVETNRALRKN